MLWLLGDMLDTAHTADLAGRCYCCPAMQRMYSTTSFWHCGPDGSISADYM